MPTFSTFSRKAETKGQQVNTRQRHPPLPVKATWVPWMCQQPADIRALMWLSPTLPAT